MQVNSKNRKEEVASLVDSEVQQMLSEMLESDIVLVSHVVNRWGVQNFIKGMHNMGVDFGYLLVVPTHVSEKVN